MEYLRPVMSRSATFLSPTGHATATERRMPKTWFGLMFAEAANRRLPPDGRSVTFCSINLNIRALMPHECASCVPLVRAKEETLWLAKLAKSSPEATADGSPDDQHSAIYLVHSRAEIRWEIGCFHAFAFSK